MSDSDSDSEPAGVWSGSDTDSDDEAADARRARYKRLVGALREAAAARGRVQQRLLKRRFRILRVPSELRSPEAQHLADLQCL